MDPADRIGRSRGVGDYRVPVARRVAAGPDSGPLRAGPVHARLPGWVAGRRGHVQPGPQLGAGGRPRPAGGRHRAAVAHARRQRRRGACRLGSGSRLRAQAALRVQGHSPGSHRPNLTFSRNGRWRLPPGAIFLAGRRHIRPWLGPAFVPDLRPSGTPRRRRTSGGVPVRPSGRRSGPGRRSCRIRCSPGRT